MKAPDVAAPKQIGPALDAKPSLFEREIEQPDPGEEAQDQGLH